jgi:para-nitrobenzyl esterase
MRALLIASLVWTVACDSPSTAPPGPGGDGGAGGCPSEVAPGPGVVATDIGPFTGARTGAGWSWKGIPYAAPPVGALRWKAPAPAACVPSGRDATAFGAVCPQAAQSAPTMVGGGALVGSEDCLTLNVWAPDGATGLPVMVFIHGGANVQGSGSLPAYEGTKLAAAGPAIVVTFNYRLGTLGYLMHPALAAESGSDGTSGNYGLLDQIAALDFVKRNIAAFGGDPARVMIFGESAGAVNVCALMAAPRAAGLFSAALMESGSCLLGPASQQQALVDRLLSATGCAGAADVASCLRARSVEELFAAVPLSGGILARATAFAPHVDGVVMPESPHDALAAGHAHRVPFVVGSNSDETALAVAQSMPPIATAADYEARIRASFPAATADAILARYPASAFPSPARAYATVTTDARFICQARLAARRAAAGLGAPVRRFFFTHAAQNAGPTVRALGAYHGLELAWVFGNFSAFAGYQPTAAEAALSTAIQGYWTRLAATSDPNGAGAPAWPLYDAASDATLVLDDPITAGGPIRPADCDFFDALAGF